jgi:hypothetical protein
MDADRGLTQSMPAEEIRQRKVAHETAIPTGVYKVGGNGLKVGGIGLKNEII